MRPSGILETVLYAVDLTSAERFYSLVLGLKVVRSDSRQVFFRCGDGMLLIFNPEETVKPVDASSPCPVPPHGTAGDGHACFRASGDEIEAWKTWLERHGIDIEAEFKWPSGGRSIYFRDPAGNSLEFAEPGIWGLA